MIEEKKKLNEFIDGVGSFIEYWGFRKIHGRIWARVYVSDRPLSTPEIVRSLGVSKALVSGALNELLEHKLVIKVGQVKFGGVTYIACPNPAEVVRDIVRNRELILFEKLQSDLTYLDKLNVQESKMLGINRESIKSLKILTGYHKKITAKLCKRNINTFDDWISFIKKISRFTI
jgi:DNA-binding transcriptional regulator GbsR (MarR family)